MKTYIAKGGFAKPGKTIVGKISVGPVDSNAGSPASDANTPNETVFETMKDAFEALPDVPGANAQS